MQVKVYIGDTRGDWDDRMVTVDDATVNRYGLAAAVLEEEIEAPEGWRVIGVVDPATGEEITQF